GGATEAPRFVPRRVVGVTVQDRAPSPPIQVGILTKGRPMLATVIANMVLQDEYPLEIFIVDTGDQPAIKRVDVVSVLRLAQDRGVRCEYELHRDRQRQIGRAHV